MSRLASGSQWKPHLKKVDGWWVVRWRAPYPSSALKVHAEQFRGRTLKMGTRYIEVLPLSVHFMTNSSERGRLARSWCARMNNGPTVCGSLTFRSEGWASIITGDRR